MSSRPTEADIATIFNDLAKLDSERAGRSGRSTQRTEAERRTANGDRHEDDTHQKRTWCRGGRRGETRRAARRTAREEAAQARASIKEATDFEEAPMTDSKTTCTEEPYEVAMERGSPTSSNKHVQQQQQSGRPTARRLEAEHVPPVQAEAYVALEGTRSPTQTGSQWGPTRRKGGHHQYGSAPGCRGAHGPFGIPSGHPRRWFGFGAFLGLFFTTGPLWWCVHTGPRTVGFHTRGGSGGEWGWKSSVQGPPVDSSDGPIGGVAKPGFIQAQTRSVRFVRGT